MRGALATGAGRYRLGHGYAPRFTVTFPSGEQRTGEIQWRPVEPSALLSECATKFEPPDVTDDEQRRTGQLAVTAASGTPPRPATWSGTGRPDSGGRRI